MIYKKYIDIKKGKFLTLTEYNRYAQQAHRKGITTVEYLSSLGYVKVWGNGRGRRNWKLDSQNMGIFLKLEEICQNL